MRIAALGDIHGNFRALVRVLADVEAWQPDMVVILGDIINRGPRSRACLELIQEKASRPDWFMIRGNHEGYVLNFRDPGFSRTGDDFALRRVIHWTYQSLSDQHIEEISQLPEELRIDDSRAGPVLASHASTAGDRIGIYPGTPDRELSGLIPPDARLFLVGHTHQALVRSYRDTTIVNAGSVGLPFDGDTRAGYARLTYHQGAWEGKITRVAYDIEAAKEDFYSSGFIPEGGALAELILAELTLGWPQLGKWFRKYEQPFRQGQIGLKEAVYEFLKNPNIEYRDPHHPR